MTRVSSTGMAAVSLARLSGGVRPESALVASLDFFASRVDARPSSAPRHNNNAPRQTLPRCDVHAGHLLRACRPTAAMWRVLGAHVAGFHPNTPTPKTTARRLRRLFERAAAATVRLRAVLGGPRARQWHELAPAGAQRTRRPTGGSVHGSAAKLVLISTRHTLARAGLANRLLDRHKVVTDNGDVLTHRQATP